MPNCRGATIEGSRNRGEAPTGAHPAFHTQFERGSLLLASANGSKLISTLPDCLPPLGMKTMPLKIRSVMKCAPLKALSGASR